MDGDEEEQEHRGCRGGGLVVDQAGDCDREANGGAEDAECADCHHDNLFQRLLVPFRALDNLSRALVERSGFGIGEGVGGTVFRGHIIVTFALERYITLIQVGLMLRDAIVVNFTSVRNIVLVRGKPILQINMIFMLVSRDSVVSQSAVRVYDLRFVQILQLRLVDQRMHHFLPSPWHPYTCSAVGAPLPKFPQPGLPHSWP